MEKKFISNKYDNEKIELKGVLNKLEQFAEIIKNNELKELLSNLFKSIDEPFSFVIVGEVKAGKSSFINALLKSNICKVDIDICTDIVQEITYSEEPYTKNISTYLTKVGLNKEILKKISVIDTPGTNSMIDHHQVITERFIPNSDLVFFVFPSTNPHTKTAWDLLSFVKDDWKKRVVFILQKADFLSKEELDVNLSKVKSYAQEKNVENPIVFPVSAKKEENNEENSGFQELRKFIEQNITGDKYSKLKLLSIVNSITEILSRLNKDINLYKLEIKSYTEIVNEIKGSLKNDEDHSRYEIDSLIDRLIGGYNKVASDFKKDLKRVLSYGKFLKIAIPFNRGNSIKSEIETLEANFKEKVMMQFQLEAKDGARYFVDGIRKLLESLIEDLNKLENTVKDEDFFSKIPDNRENIIEDVRKKLEEFLNNDTFVKTLESSLPESLSPALLTEGAIAIISGIILASTNITFLDVTGGILTSLGVIVSSGALIFKRNKIINQFQIEIDKVEREFQEDIRRILNEKFDIIYKTINESFTKLYDYVEKNNQKKQPLIKKFENIELEANTLLKEIKSKIN